MFYSLCKREIGIGIRINTAAIWCLGTLLVNSVTSVKEKLGSMKSTLRLYIGPFAWRLALVLSLLIGFMLVGEDRERREAEEVNWILGCQLLAWYCWMLFLVVLDHSPREYKYVWYDKGGSVTLWLRLKRDSKQGN